MRITFTPEQAAETTFPQGCPVLYIRPRQSEGDDDVASVEEEDFLVGAVQSVSVDVSAVSMGTRDFFYTLNILGMEGTETATESSLRFAPRCPVLVRDTFGATVACVGRREGADGKDVWREGSIISSYRILSYAEGSPSTAMEDKPGGTSCSWLYSASVVLPSGSEGVFHGMMVGDIKYRQPKGDSNLNSTSVQQPAGQAGSTNVQPSAAQRALPAACASAVSSDEDDSSVGAGAHPTIRREGRPLSRKDSDRSIRGSSAIMPAEEGGASPRQKRRLTRRNSSSTNGEENEEERQAPSSGKRSPSFLASEDRLERHLDTGRPRSQSELSSGNAGDAMPEVRVIMPDRGFVYTLDIPPWLSMRSVTSNIVGKGGFRHKQLEHRFKCKIILRGKGSGSKVQSGEGPKDHLQALIKDLGTQSSNIGRAMRAIEDALIEFVKDSAFDKSLGRLLYELEAAKEWGDRKNRSVGPVFQRSDRDLSTKCWMDVLELPFDSEGNAYHGRFLVGQGGSLLSEIRKSYDCTIDVFGVFDGLDRLLCDPYVIIRSDERSLVIKAKKFVIFKIKEHQRKCPRNCALRWES
mmetsp:Transcript_13090/g.38492  ORF Transcript_13090/g.38492 Transcript_13090/m.38492 type:complete len:578 (-) Transcript_13090:2381-4114(-)